MDQALSLLSLILTWTQGLTTQQNSGTELSIIRAGSDPTIRCYPQDFSPSTLKEPKTTYDIPAGEGGQEFDNDLDYFDTSGELTASLGAFDGELTQMD